MQCYNMILKNPSKNVLLQQLSIYAMLREKKFEFDIDNKSLNMKFSIDYLIYSIDIFVQQQIQNIMTAEFFLQFRLLIKSSDIGQYVPSWTVEGVGRGSIVRLANWKKHFIRVCKNLLQYPLIIYPLESVERYNQQVK